jgi:antitoxin component of MazEF toxin-antitoxin module
VRPLQKRGNGICASIPRELQKRLAWNVKDAVTYDVIDGSLVLTKIKLPSVPDLRLSVREHETAS